MKLTVMLTAKTDARQEGRDVDEIQREGGDCARRGRKKGCKSGLDMQPSV